MSVKPEGGVEECKDPGEEIITVKLLPQNDTEPVTIKARKKTLVEKLVEAWSKHANVNPKSIRLYYDGQKLPPHQTLLNVGIEDGDQIDVTLEQVGGTRCNLE
eukprot:TRINITY_DN12766_c0_g1_i1.p1 TRINITY_DN12766_c0_g1~~TRINITY_DN12766_c0_g1_i1.p1  ORF type:complete len:103 (-),score=14.45 TRINITY_DN12766_c0_g1_i1:157-465(-)